MTNLVLSRKAGQSVRLIIDGRTEYVEILEVTGGYCKFRLLSNLQVERTRFKDSLQIADGVSVQVVDLAKGRAKLMFTAPYAVHILRAELVKEEL